MNYREVAMQWTGPEYDEQTRAEVRALLKGDEKELEDAFYRNLKFLSAMMRPLTMEHILQANGMVVI